MKQMQSSLKSGLKILEIKNCLKLETILLQNHKCFLFVEQKNEQNVILGKTVIDFRAHLREREKNSTET